MREDELVLGVVSQEMEFYFLFFRFSEDMKIKMKNFVEL